MLFGYPLQATADNWLHDCLTEVIRVIHECLRTGQEPPDWPEILPEVFREELKSRVGLRDRLVAYQNAAATLNVDELNQLDLALHDQNEIESLLSALRNCKSINDLPQAMREPIKDLFGFGFELLSKIGVRDKQYSEIYESTPYHVCPFCGCEYFDAPGAPREALDHYLAESKYPYAAANLRNLVPMGNKCNSKYKLAEDVMYRGDGTRRRSFYPYSYEGGVHISLENSEPFSGDEGVFSTTTWQVDFEPMSEEVTTWDEIFHIRDRFVRDVLDVEIKSWLWAFGAWCRSASVKAKSMKDVVDALQKYSTLMEDIGVNDRSFLKAAVFRMLYLQCQQGNQRLKYILSGLVFGVGALV